MSRPSRLDYAYSVGRIRALEKKMVSRDVFLEAAGEREFESALKIIFDAGSFADDLLGIKNSAELDRFILAEEEHLNKLAGELFIDDKFRDTFYKKFLRKKTLLKNLLIFLIFPQETWKGLFIMKIT